MPDFKVCGDFEPAGGQAEAIDALARGVEEGLPSQTLLGVTGSGKTYVIAKVIERVRRPTLVLAHNKTLAAQLCEEFRHLFPHNAVEYFVSYYDYYRPEAYIPTTDTYVEKDSSINDEIERLRHSASSSLFERRDVLVVCSVSCIYSLGSPEEYGKMTISLRPGMEKPRARLIKDLVEIRYTRNDVAFEPGCFRVRGGSLDIYPVYSAGHAVRVEYFGDEIERITEFQVSTGALRAELRHVAVYPASHYITERENIERAARDIEKELHERAAWFREQGKELEAQRLTQRTMFDLEMLREAGFCSGVENYSRVIAGRAPGSTPHTLMDYFPKDYMLVVDESHVTLPQVRAMHAGDRARKKALIDYGFRLPSAYDNRPLRFDEFCAKQGVTLYVSATPASYEREQSDRVVELVLRPTGLLDPEISVRPVAGQIDDLYGEINARASRGERVLVTALTKKMAEDLTAYLQQLNVKARYMHHQVDTLERMELLRDLRLGVFDVLVGINLLREGLDLPEVSLVAILDADKEGFLRSDTALVQTIGRAARHEAGLVIMYADKITPSMSVAIAETNRRREMQKAHNERHGIVPKSIVKDVRDTLEVSRSAAEKERAGNMTERERRELIERMEADMKKAAKMLEFEYAALLRDRIIKLRAGK
ncbi:MAG: excinuclease ABC subunit UvrB [Oscillospiraceae bacterium]|nr:excinuclease ABC subunit UvrB [Oscillospiraceae bacterium]